MPQEGWPLVWNLGTIFGTAFIASSVFILALFLGFCIIFGFPKLRSTLGHKSMVIKSPRLGVPVVGVKVTINDAVPVHMSYIGGSAFGAGSDISFSLDGKTFAAPAMLSVKENGVECAA